MSDTPQAKDVFADALELQPTERGDFARQRCAGDGALLAEVLDLIATHEKARHFLGSPTAPSNSHGPGPGKAEGPGSVIGRYRLLEALGEGGFGTVFLAEQREPVVRRVALKIIKAGMDTAQVIARFEAERQTLAVMDHPNIAKVLDAGATDLGRPYFVMEFVQGLPITRFCDQHNRTIAERLALFTQVCQAVQHAHTKGIIHRDIKPGNILISMEDGRDLVRVIDFGIAKAIDQAGAAQAAFTELRQMIGTPEYMSPEQAAGGPDIDTRTDVYSLGVLLYELLTGTTPIDPERLRSAQYAELQRIIREVEPPQPSTRLSESSGTISGIAASRRTEPKKLGTIVRGELDWIVMKALEKDRTRRYETASAMAEDVLGYLAGRPVMAAPPSRAYQAKKFVRRHRGPVAAASLVTIALLLGVIGTSVELARARAAEREQSSLRVLAEQQRDRSSIVATFMRRTFEGLTPEMARGRDTALLSDIVDRAAAKIHGGEIAKNPDAEAELRLTLAGAYTELARFEDAGRMLAPALERLRADPHADPTILGWGISSAAGLAAARRDNAGAEALYREALGVQTRVANPDHSALAASYAGLGELLRIKGQMDEAIEQQGHAVEHARAAYDASDPALASALNGQASAFKAKAQYANAEPLYNEALAILERSSPQSGDHPALAGVLTNRGALRLATGHPDTAESDFSRALAINRKLLPAQHPDIAIGLHNLAAALAESGRLAESEPLLREALDMERRLYPGDSPDVASTLMGLGAVLAQEGKFDAALSHSEEALAMHRRLFTGDNPDTANDLRNIATQLKGLGRTEDAERTLREAIGMTERLSGSDNPDLGDYLLTLGNMVRDRGAPGEAADLYRRAIAIMHRTLPADHPRLADALAAKGIVLVKVGTASAVIEAQEALRECYVIRKKRLPEGDWRLANTMSSLGGAMIAGLELGSPQGPEARLACLREAEPILQTGFDRLLADAAHIPANFRATRVGDAADYLARLYKVWDAEAPSTGKDSLADQWKKRSLEVRASLAIPAR